MNLTPGRHALLINYLTGIGTSMRFRPRGVSARYISRIARRAVGTTLVKRVHVTESTIPDITSSNFDTPLIIPLIRGIEAQDETVESDGTNIADAPLYSKVIALRLHVAIKGGSGGAESYRWMLIKSPDNDITISSLQGSTFHTSNDDTADRELRSATLAKGEINMSASNLVAFPKLFVKRKTLHRLGTLRENDRLVFAVAKNASGTTGLLNMWGNIWIRAM